MLLSTVDGCPNIATMVAVTKSARTFNMSDNIWTTNNASSVYDTAQVGQEIAVDSNRRFVSYRFGVITRITKSQIEVKLKSPASEKEELLKFSKATHRPLQQASWNDQWRLVSAESARAALARDKVRREVRQEQQAIKAEFDRLRDAEWTTEVLVQLIDLQARVRKWIEN
jgi:hypothetical protein